MPSNKSTRGLGWGPLSVTLFLLIAALFALTLGRDLLQLGVRLALVAAFTGGVYAIWHEASRKNPAFHMGSPEANTIILVLSAIGFLVLASDPIASSAGGLVGYPGLDLINGPVTDYSATLTLGILFVTLALGLFIIAAVLLMSRRRH